jgi:predicted dehydrogenase
VKIGLIGLGNWAQKLIACLPNPQELNVVLTQREGLSEIIPTGTKVARTYEEFLSSEPDRVIIANQASKHLETLIKIRSALPKVPIFIEKPFALNVKEAQKYEEIFGLDDNLIVNHTLLFNKNLWEIKQKHLKASPQKIYCADCNLGPYREDCNSLWDYGPHVISVALYLCAAETYPLNVEVLEASNYKTTYGELVTFRLNIQDETEVIASVGNGFPLKMREYQINYGDGVVEKFNGLDKVEPTPLHWILKDFCSRNEIRQSGNFWGIGMSLKVVKAISDIENLLKLNSSKKSNFD